MQNYKDSAKDIFLDHINYIKELDINLYGFCDEVMYIVRDAIYHADSFNMFNGEIVIVKDDGLFAKLCSTKEKALSQNINLKEDIRQQALNYLKTFEDV